MKIEYPFVLDKEGVFRFSLCLESNSVEAHSLLIDNMHDIAGELKHCMIMGESGYDIKDAFN